MVILVTGARGMLGSDLCPIASQGHEVIATDIPEMDVRDPRLVEKAVADAGPDIVIHLAAATDVDGCERDPAEAYRTNTIGTIHVALACRRVGAAMVYICTGSVYDGSKPEPYIEWDTPNPLSQYARSKLQGEMAVREILPEHYIVYAGWMFGGGKEDKKFVARIIDLARSRPELKVVDDKFGSPTYTRDMARAILKLIETGLYGRYHMANTGWGSRFQVAQAIVEEAGITSCRLVPVASAEFPLPAPRPRMEAIRNYHCELRGWDWMRPWRDALRDYIRTEWRG